MTTDLDRLIEAVEAEEALKMTTVIHSPVAKWGSMVMASFDASLDAAVSLLEALLPEWRAEIHICGRFNHAEVEEAGGRETACANNMPSPARALLLATLRAYRSTREGG